MAIPANTIRHAMASRRIIPARLIAPAGGFCSTVLLRFLPREAPALTQAAWDRAAPSALTLHSALRALPVVDGWPAMALRRGRQNRLESRCRGHSCPPRLSRDERANSNAGEGR